MKINEKVINLINEVIQINNDRIEGYERTANETEDSDLKDLFNSLASKSRLFRSELISEVIKRGGKPTESTTTSGKVFRLWMDFKAAVTGKDRKAILNSCEFGEDVTLSIYDNVLDSEHLPADVAILLRTQRAKLDDDHDHVKELRDSVVHHL